MMNHKTRNKSVYVVEGESGVEQVFGSTKNVVKEVRAYFESLGEPLTGVSIAVALKKDGCWSHAGKTVRHWPIS